MDNTKKEVSLASERITSGLSIAGGVQDSGPRAGEAFFRSACQAERYERQKIFFADVTDARDRTPYNRTSKPLIQLPDKAMLKIEISKRPDGSGVLLCTREDGSITWQKQTRLHAAHFALHDLTHYVVETSLGYRRGFFGLIAEGWDVEDTGGKGSRGALPTEAIEVERIVGLFDVERGSGVLWTTEEFNDFAPRVVTNEQIQNIRAGRADLFQRWFDTASAEKLELLFEPPPSPSSRPSPH